MVLRTEREVIVGASGWSLHRMNMFSDSKVCGLLTDRPHHGISINNLTLALVSGPGFIFSTSQPLSLASRPLLHMR